MENVIVRRRLVWPKKCLFLSDITSVLGVLMVGVKATRARVLLTLTAFLTLSHQQAFGDTITAWTSSGSGNWNDPTNWTIGGGVPNNSGGNVFTAILQDNGTSITH